MAVSRPLPVHWDVRAADDLKDIFNSIKKDSPQNALHVVVTLMELAESLGDFPEKYPVLELSNRSKRSYRSVPKWSYKLIYEVLETEIRVVLIFNSRQDPLKLEKGRDA